MIPHNRPYLDNSIDFSGIIETGMIASASKVSELEEKIAAYLGGGHACLCSSGTAALALALHALGITEGDRIITPTYVCSAVLNAIHFVRAVPVLTDIDEATFNISLDTIMQADHADAAAVIVPHMYGVPAGLDEIAKLNIPIIEDCAQAIGAAYHGRRVGTIGDISIFSFYATKLMTTGYGGLVFSKNKDLVDMARDFMNFDCRREYHPRFNFYLSDMNAALGLSQLEKLHEMLERRNSISAEYARVISGKGLRLQALPANAERVYYRYVLISDRIAEIKNLFAENGIETIVPIEPYELLHNYLKDDRGKYPSAEKVSETTLSLPVYPALTDEEVNKISGVLELV